MEWNGASRNLWSVAEGSGTEMERNARLNELSKSHMAYISRISLRSITVAGTDTSQEKNKLTTSFMCGWKDMLSA